MLLVRQTSSTIIDDVPSKPITDNSCTIIYIHILLETSDCSFKFHNTHHKNDKVLILLLVNLGAAYNKCIKKLFGYARSHSMSSILLELIFQLLTLLCIFSCSVCKSFLAVTQSDRSWFANIAVR